MTTPLTRHLGALRKEQKGFEDFKVHCVERFDALQLSLGKPEQKVTVLQSQWSANRKSLDELSERLLPARDLTDSLAARLLDMETKEQTAWNLIRELREDMHELRQEQFAANDGSHGECMSLRTSTV